MRIFYYIILVLCCFVFASYGQAAIPFFETAKTFYQKAQYIEAIHIIKQEKEKNEDKIFPDFLLAWIYSTCPDNNVRNFRKALEHASELHFQTIICTVTYFYVDDPLWKQLLWMPWSVSASAYAEQGDFSRAILAQKTAILFSHLLPSNLAKHKKFLQSRLNVILKLYENNISLQSEVIIISVISDQWVNSINSAKTFEELQKVAQ
jgi:hypothetical protein